MASSHLGTAGASCAQCSQSRLRSHLCATLGSKDWVYSRTRRGTFGERLLQRSSRAVPFAQRTFDFLSLRGDHVVRRVVKHACPCLGEDDDLPCHDVQSKDEVQMTRPNAQWSLAKGIHCHKAPRGICGCNVQSCALSVAFSKKALP